VLPQTGEQTAADPPTVVGDDKSPAADAEPTAAGGETGDQTVAIPAPVRDLPAGIDPTEYADAPAASAPRGKLRRRLRYLRRVRDLLLRDLGGFTFEIRRTVGGAPTEAHRKLVESKMNRIEALDAEVRALEGRLGEPHDTAVLREPGIGGTCPECGELYSSDAHYCSRCGAPLDAKARAKRDAAVAAAVHEKPAAEPAPASVLWAAGPRPEAAEPEPEEQPSEVTSRWLAVPRAAPADGASAADATPEGEAAPAETPDVPAVDESGEAAADESGEAAAAPDEPDQVGAETPAEVAAETPAEVAAEPSAEVGADEPAEVGAEAPDEVAAEQSAEPGAEPSEEAAPEPSEDAAPEPTGAEKPDEAVAEQPEFNPGPNGRKTDDVPEPDPLPTREERGT
jgi:hypothetical protein